MSSEDGFRRIVLLNGNYCNSHALQFAASRILDELPEGTRIYPFPYWQGLRPEEPEQYLSGSVGIHANVGETSIVLRSTRACATWSASATWCRSTRIYGRARSRSSTPSSSQPLARSGRSSRRAESRAGLCARDRAADVVTVAIVGAGFMGSAHAGNYAALGDRVG